MEIPLYYGDIQSFLRTVPAEQVLIMPHLQPEDDVKRRSVQHENRWKFYYMTNIKFFQHGARM
jgi:hypothetical protein